MRNEDYQETASSSFHSRDDDARQFGSVVAPDERNSSSSGAQSAMQEEALKFQKKKALQDQYNMLFQSMIEIIDVIAE